MHMWANGLVLESFMQEENYNFSISLLQGFSYYQSSAVQTGYEGYKLAVFGNSGFSCIDRLCYKLKGWRVGNFTLKLIIIHVYISANILKKLS